MASCKKEEGDGWQRGEEGWKKCWMDGQREKERESERASKLTFLHSESMPLGTFLVDIDCLHHLTKPQYTLLTGRGKRLH